MYCHFSKFTYFEPFGYCVERVDGSLAVYNSNGNTLLALYISELTTRHCSMLK